jgi:hypothetical protein
VANPDGSEIPAIVYKCIAYLDKEESTATPFSFSHAARCVCVCVCGVWCVVCGVCCVLM